MSVDLSVGRLFPDLTLPAHAGNDRELSQLAGDDPPAFNRNLLHRLNRELGSDFDAARFAYVARWDPEHEWMEMRLQAEGTQCVHFAALDLTVAFGDGEAVRTEISAKFRREGLYAELGAVGLEPAGWWTDPAGDFAVSLSVQA